MDELPITISGALSVVGMVVIAGLLTQWLKQYIPEDKAWRDIAVNTICLVLTMALAATFQAIQSEWTPTAAEMGNALLLAFIATSVTTFGYEVVANLMTLVKPQG